MGSSTGAAPQLDPSGRTDRRGRSAPRTGRPRPLRRSGWQILGAAVVAAALATTVAACTSAGSSSSGGDPEQAVAMASAAPALPESGAVGERDAAAESAGANSDGAPDPAAGGDPAAAQAPLTTLSDGRQVIRTAALSVELSVPPAEQPAGTSASDQRDADGDARRAAVNQATSTVRGIATSVGGFVAGAEGSGSSMTVTLRVPAEQYDSVLDRVSALGEVTARTESSQDVTTEIVDVNSRVETMTASVARVRALLAGATEIADVIAIEGELAAREANLESLLQQQAALSGQVALSTVTVNLTAVTSGPGAATEEPQDGFLAGLAAGWSALLDFFAWFGAAIGALLPFLPIFLAAAALVWWLVRRARRNARAARAVGPSGAAPVPAAGHDRGDAAVVTAEIDPVTGERRDRAPVG